MRQRALLVPGDRVVVACSGGPDSIVLVHVLTQLAAELRIAIIVASIDHGLREESAEEVLRVGELARSLDLPFASVRVRVTEGDSLQARARDARYAALHEIADAHEATKIAVGHTRDDQAETVLDRILRGAGIRGLAGIDPHRVDGIVRPLIDATRAEVEAYLAHHGLPALRDPSNEALRFRRVRVRKHLLPMLESEATGVASHLADLADEARELIGSIEAEVPTLPLDALPLALLESLPPPVRRATLRRFVVQASGQPPSRAHIEALEHMIHAPSELWLKGGLRVLRSEHMLFVDRSLQHRGRVARRSKKTARGDIREPDESDGSQD